MKILTEQEISDVRSNPDNYGQFYWIYLSAFYALSEDFIREFYNKLKPEYLIQNKNIPQSIKETIKLLL